MRHHASTSGGARTVTLDSLPLNLMDVAHSPAGLPGAVFRSGVMVCVNGAPSPGFAAVLSHTGMELLTRRVLEPSSAVELRFSVPGLGRLQLAATPRWQRARHDGAHVYLTGLTFEALSDAERSCLSQWVQQGVDPSDGDPGQP